VTLFAEMFHEMLQTRFGLGILLALQMINAKAEGEVSASKSSKTSKKTAETSSSSSKAIEAMTATASKLTAGGEASAQLKGDDGPGGDDVGAQLEGAPSVSEPSVESLKRPTTEPSALDEPSAKKARGVPGDGGDPGERWRGPIRDGGDPGERWRGPIRDGGDPGERWGGPISSSVTDNNKPSN